MVFPALRAGMQATTNALNNTAQMAQASQALQAQQNMQPMTAAQTQALLGAYSLPGAAGAQNPGGMNAASGALGGVGGTGGNPYGQMLNSAAPNSATTSWPAGSGASGTLSAQPMQPQTGAAAVQPTAAQLQQNRAAQQAQEQMQQQYMQMTPQQQQAFAQAGSSMMSPYGYGQGPNSSNRGFYEQQTPAGSFAAADQQRAGAFTANPYTANSNTASNQYIGQTSAGIGGQASVMPYAQQAAQNAMRDNPYLGQTTGQASAATNSMAGLNNPYLTNAIDAASSDATRNYNMAIAPQRDRQMQQSGSFGNTGIQQMQLEDQRNFGQTLGNIANSARMADYNQQFGAAENLANRQTGVSQFNSGLNAGDIGRNMGGFFTGQGLGLQGTSQLVDAAKFDSTMGNNVNQFNSTLGANDLARNAQLQQGLGQFNAGQLNNMNQFNASALNNMGQFNAGAMNTNSMFNAGQGNNMNMFNAGAANNMLSQYRNLNEQGRQFDETLDYNIYRGNAADARGANQDYIGMINALTGLNSGAYNMAGNAYQAPWQYLMQAGNLGSTIGGMGGTTSSTMSGNPMMGLIGGYMMGNQIFNPRGG